MLMPEEIVTEVAKRLNMPREQVRTIMADFWYTIKVALENPHKSFIRGIRVRKCAIWSLNPNVTIKKYLAYLTKWQHTPSFKKLYSIHKRNLKYEIYSQKQSEYVQKCEGLILQNSREQGVNQDEDSSQQ
jgi:hypothetical protein